MKYLLEIKSLFSFFLAVVSVTSSPAQRLLNGQKPRVVIIGAGVAGIGAASKLLQNGITDVTILEAMNRIGGRIHYVPFGDGEGVDLGAHWIHGQEDNVVYELAEPLGLVNHSGDLANQLLFRPDGSELKLDRGYLEIYEDLFQDVHLLGNSHNFRTLAEVSDFRIEEYGRLIGLSKADIRGLQLHARKNLCTLEGCEDLTDVSLKASDDYEEGEGDELIEWKKGGMANILHLLMGTHGMSPWKGLGVEKTIMLNSRVSRIEWFSMNGAHVVIENRRTKAADFVIFTPSLNVLKKKHTSMFYPTLPQDKVDAIKALGMDVVDKVFLVFNQTWWPQSVTGFVPLHSKIYPTETEDWGEAIIDFVAEHHNPLVLGTWLNGKGAKKMELASDQEVIDTTMRIIRQYVGKSFDIPDPAFMLRSQWRINQDIAGSYSYSSVASEKLFKPRESLASPLINRFGKPVVLFAGEATHSQHYSTVHGALESGWREAERIIQYVTTK